GSQSTTAELCLRALCRRKRNTIHTWSRSARTCFDRSVLLRRQSAFGEVLKARGILDEGQLERSGRAVALLGNDNLSDAFQFRRDIFFPVVILLAKDEGDDVG